MKKNIIKATKVLDKIFNFEKIVYKRGNERLAEIEFPHSNEFKKQDKYIVFCAYTRTGCLSFGYFTLDMAIERTEDYIRGIYSGNCEIQKCY